MKKFKYIILGLTACAFSACVDDYEDANPPRLLDAPAVSSTQSEDEIDVTGGEEVTFTIVITDAPAGLASVSVTSKEDETKFTSNIMSLVGAESGTLTVDYTVPYTNIGKFDVNVGILDSQTDDKGEDVSKTSTVTFNMVGEYAFEAPVHTVTATEDELFQGESTPFSIVVTAADGGGIGRVSVSTDFGTVELDEASITAALGKKTATITGTFTAIEGEVGTAVITALVEDVLQVRTSTSSITVDVVYKCDAANFEITVVDSEISIGEETDFTVTIVDVACNIAEITFEMMDDEDNTRGSVAVDDAHITALIGKTNGEVSGVYSAEDMLRGVLDLKAIIRDTDNQITEKSVQISVVEEE